MMKKILFILMVLAMSGAAMAQDTGKKHRFDVCNDDGISVVTNRSALSLFPDDNATYAMATVGLGLSYDIDNVSLGLHFGSFETALSQIALDDRASVVVVSLSERYYYPVFDQFEVSTGFEAGLFFTNNRFTSSGNKYDFWRNGLNVATSLGLIFRFDKDEYAGIEGKIHYGKFFDKTITLPDNLSGNTRNTMEGYSIMFVYGIKI